MTQGFLPSLPVDLMTVSSDFLIEVAKGNVAGHSIRTVVARNADVNGSNEHIWGGVTDMIYPTAAESWEIVSTSANDTAVGSGAQQVLVNSLDGDYNRQQQVVALNGTTPVALTGTHLRPDGAAVINSGSSRVNEGEIVIRAAGGGNPRQYIPLGFANSQDCQVTVPAGKTSFGLQTVFSFPKDGDGFVGGRLRFFGTNTDLVTGEFPFYQNITEY